VTARVAAHEIVGYVAAITLHDAFRGWIQVTGEPDVVSPASAVRMAGHEVLGRLPSERPEI
jgi:hypothetical protein